MSFVRSDLFRTFLFEKVRMYGEEYMKSISAPRGTLPLPILSYIKTEDDDNIVDKRKESASAYIASNLVSMDDVMSKKANPVSRCLQQMCAIRFILPLFIAFSIIAVQLIAWGVMYNNS